MPSTWQLQGLTLPASGLWKGNRAKLAAEVCVVDLHKVGVRGEGTCLEELRRSEANPGPSAPHEAAEVLGRGGGTKPEARLSVGAESSEPTLRQAAAAGLWALRPGWPARWVSPGALPARLPPPQNGEGPGEGALGSPGREGACPLPLPGYRPCPEAGAVSRK